MSDTTLLQSLREAAAGPGAPPGGSVLVVALSGGRDSVVLLDALHRIAPGHGWSLVAAHLDHGLRDGSADDAAFPGAV